jgi:dTDP-4-dehydrorhamnose reductase
MGNNTTEKILILGSNGRIGTKLIDYSLKKGYYPVGIDFAVEPVNKEIGEFDYFSVDLQQVHPLVSAILGASPDIMIFTAGINDVDFCEQENEMAYAINVETVSTIVKIASQIGTKVVFISCSQVFSGEKNSPYTEDDVPEPINFYGKSKLEAEKLIATLDDFLIIRTSYPFYSPFVKKGVFRDLLSSLENAEEVILPVDNKISPVSVDFVAEAVMLLLEKREKGIFNISSKDALSEYQFAKLVAEVFEYPAELIKGMPLSEMKHLARRPKNTALSFSKLTDAVNLSIPHIEDSLKHVKLLYFSKKEGGEKNGKMERWSII